MRNQGDVSVDEWIAAEKALQEALANEALNKMAENARELGLDYEPAQQEPVAWRWLYNGQPDSEKHFSMPGPDAAVISRAAACEFPRTVQYLYTSPPAQRTWVGLTLADRETLRDRFEGWNYPAVLVDAISDILKEKNGYAEGTLVETDKEMMQ